MRPPAPWPYQPWPPKGDGLLAALVGLCVLGLVAADNAGLVDLRAAAAGNLAGMVAFAPHAPQGGGEGGKRTTARVCPVQGATRIGSGWGDPRDGGARRHQGVDLMAPAGRRLQAVEAGRIGRRWGNDGGRAGIRLWLQGDSGTHYFYAHNRRNLARPGQRVRKGEPVAEVGNTGNARTTPSHVHFEIHPHGGRAVDPGPLVRRWCQHRPPAAGPPPGRAAQADIPPSYLRLYREAGAANRVPWSVLAGIGKVESDHGRSRLPGVRSGANRAGACGPMQIGCVHGSKAGNSWARYGQGDPHDPAAAIPAAARYLVAHGAHRDLDRAIHGYNHSWAYVALVKRWARRYQH